MWHMDGMHEIYMDAWTDMTGERMGMAWTEPDGKSQHGHGTHPCNENMTSTANKPFQAAPNQDAGRGEHMEERDLTPDHMGC